MEEGRDLRDGFVVVGPGRCGTKAICYILGSCKNVQVNHESMRLDWYNPDFRRLDRFISKLSHPTTLMGESQHLLFPHLAYIRHKNPRIKVVCLHREMSDQVASVMKVANRIMPIPYPSFPGCSIQQSYEVFWLVCEGHMSRVRNPVFHLSVEDLNGDLGPLHDFLGIPESDRVTPMKRRIP